MDTRRVGAVAGWVLFIELHIAQQPRPRVASFQQIVTEDTVLGKAAVERPLERVHVVNALADERAFTKEVLIHIGDGAGIRIDARLTPEQSRIPRQSLARQTHGHTRL